MFLLYRGWGLYDTRIGLILIYTVITLPLSVWMMYAYFRQLPKEMEEAALVDGCTRWGAFWRVALPLAVPASWSPPCSPSSSSGPSSSSRSIDQPQRVHAADHLPGVPRLPGVAVRRGERASP